MNTLIASLTTPLLLFCSQALASTDHLGANVIATGSAGVAAIADDSAVTLNPGALGLVKRYDFSGRFETAPDGYSLGGAVVDSKTSPVAFGVSYRYINTNDLSDLSGYPGWVAIDEEPTNLKRDHSAAIGLAIPVINRRLSIGVNGDVTWHNANNTGKETSFDADFGIAARATKNLSFGVVAEGLYPHQSSYDLPPSLLSGAQWVGTRGLLALDGRYSTGIDDGVSPLSLYTGGEIFLSLVRIRGGYQIVGPDSASAVTLGLGSESQTGALEYAISVPLTGPDPILHYLGLRIRTSPKDRELTK